MCVDLQVDYLYHREFVSGVGSTVAALEARQLQIAEDVCVFVLTEG